MKDEAVNCPHEDAVKWNPFNRVVQCHRCGQGFMPGSAAAPTEAILAAERLTEPVEPIFGSFCPECGERAGHKNGCDYKPVKIGGR